MRTQTRAAFILAAVITAGCGVEVNPQSLDPEWRSTAEPARSIEAAGETLWRDLVGVMTEAVSSHRIGPNSAARFYAYTSVAAWEAWQQHESGGSGRAAAAAAAAAAGTAAFDDPEVAEELQVLVRRNGGEQLREEGRRVASELVTVERMSAYESLAGQPPASPGPEAPGGWTWRSPGPELVETRYQPEWGRQPPLTAASCRVEEPDLTTLAAELAELSGRADTAGEVYSSGESYIWEAGLGTPTPVGIWLQAMAASENSRRIGDEEGLLMLATFTAAAYDASIIVWQAKEQYNIARPETMLQETQGALEALSYGAPNHPAYPSLRGAVAGAAAATLQRAGPTGPLLFTGDERTGSSATLFADIDTALDDLERVWAGGGRNWAASLAAGARLGACSAEEAWKELR